MVVSADFMYDSIDKLDEAFFLSDWEIIGYTVGIMVIFSIFMWIRNY